MHRRFRIASLVVTLATAFLVAAPVAAANSWTVFEETGTRAFAGKGECTELPDGSQSCESQFLDVFQGTTRQTGQPNFNGQRVCFHESVERFGADGSFLGSVQRSGCALHAGTLTINKLASITLAPTLIELRQMDCDGFECTEAAGGSVTVSGTWTGTGPTVRQSGTYKSNDGTCRQVHSQDSRSRQADFVGSLASAGAVMSQGSSTSKTTCPF